MVKYEIKSNPCGQYYLPKEVREELGPKLSMICNAKAAIIFCPDEPIDVILESLNIITQDLKHRRDIQARVKAETTAKNREDQS
jgi:bifunctional DNA-binding transcriptional regulator/antitoxin component of YhaV-PrlF toxin-antitoxin module